MQVSDGKGRISKFLSCCLELDLKTNCGEHDTRSLKLLKMSIDHVPVPADACLIGQAGLTGPGDGRSPSRAPFLPVGSIEACS